MKRIFIIILGLALLMPAFAQQKGSSIALKVVVEDAVEPFPAGAAQQISNKLNQLLTRNGIASSNYLGQFFITAFATPQQKEIVPSTPAQIAEVLEVSFYIADYQNQVIFATTTIPAKGVGPNENKAYMKAIQNINVNNPALQKFVDEGRAKIVDYYNQQAEFIMAKARSLANQKSYEEAIYMLTAIPTECEKYMAALDLSDEIYQQYIDYLCDVNLAQAKAAWAADQNSNGAYNAGEFLANIYPDAKCYGDAENLYREIKAKVLDDWKFEMKKYQDGVDLEMARIDAQKAIGVAYGTHQQPVSTNIGFLGR